MKVKKGDRDITVYVGVRPFEGEWIERQETVLNAIKWQDVEEVTVKLVFFPDEISTLKYATDNGYEGLVIGFWRHYLFPGKIRSFKSMFEAMLMDCETEIFLYINGDIILGPGILKWIQENALDRNLLMSLPRHNWNWTGPLKTIEDYEDAKAAAIPEEWTAVDLYVLRATEGRQQLIPFPPFILTAGSMDSYIVTKTGHLGWDRVLIPPEQFSMLHIEHSFSHPLKPGASQGKLAKWAFNCGVYAQATSDFPPSITQDASLKCFRGSERYGFKYGFPNRDYQAPENVLPE
ncbi:MAG: hypothetical protein QNJ58_02045 [Desulfobacterales bacterium]|nr:hypothetical protein [Desulfobacterales bacterium]